MSVVEKFMAGLITIGIITALTLPDRQTPKVLNSATGFVQGGLRTAITGKK
jgi:hypothetical protein